MDARTAYAVAFIAAEAADHADVRFNSRRNSTAYKAAHADSNARWQAVAKLADAAGIAFGDPLFNASTFAARDERARLAARA